MLGLGYFGGVINTKLEQSESNVDVMSVDSESALESSNETKKLLDAADVWFATHRAYDDDGNRTPEFVQYLESTRTTAVKRGDQTPVHRKVAEWWQDLF